MNDNSSEDAESEQSPDQLSGQSKSLKPQAVKPELSQTVGDIATRKLKAQQYVSKTVWSGLGMMGLVGWSIVIPTLLGAVLGNWLDKNYPDTYSWTLMLLVAGLCLGCFNAWHWVNKEHIEINRPENGDDLD
jgi:ATP synthase protein I